MSKNSVLYFLVKREAYRYGKVNALSAQSSILHARERIKRIKALREQEHTLRTSIIREANTVRKKIQELKKTLPSPKEKIAQALEEPETINEARIRAPKKQFYQDPIQQELSEIEAKLRELGAAP